MDEQQHESAGSSSAVEQHHTTDTGIRSRRHATDVAESTTSDPSPPENYERVKGQSDNDPRRTPESGSESSRCSASPPPLATSESATPAREPGPGTETKTPEEKQCRICLAGAEEEAELVLLSSFLATYFVPDADALNEPQMTNQRDSDSFFGASFGGIVISPLDYYTYSWDTAKDVFKLAVQTFSDISNLEDNYEFWKKDDEPDRDVLDDNKYETVHTSGKGFKSTVKIPQKTRAQRQKYPKRKHRSPPSTFERFVRWFIYRFMTGLGVVGILSFLNLLFSVGLIAPLRLFGGNWTRGQRRAAANDTASLVVIIAIIIGVARAIWLVYKLTRHIAQLLLRRAETAILEVGQVEEVAEPEPWGPYLKRVVRELPARVRTIPYHLLPSMIFGWVMMTLVRGWHAIRNWTRDAVGQMIQILRSQAKFASKSENTSQACGITTRSHKRSVSRGVIQKPSDYSNQSNAFESEEDTHMEDQAILDMQAADECMDQVHICDGPGWKVVNPCPSSSNASEECPVESMSEIVTDGLGLESGFQSAAILKNYQYREQHNIMFFKLCPKERRWLDLGPCIVTAEGELYRSTVTVRMEKTFRILATWSIFGGMKVVRFLSTVIVLAIVSDDEGVQKVMSYGLKASDHYRSERPSTNHTFISLLHSKKPKA
ncbi:hypothetical protein FRC11_005980 [Ceratobasidium sp. 423]|nr:hypothetical protein FRC11_005980 [Ceratobasidium sp. 423]